MKKNKGFSLVEMMITLGIMSAVGVGYMQMMSQQTKQSKTNMANQEATNLLTEIRAYLGKPGVCDKTFENKTLYDVVELTEIKRSNGKTKYKVGQLYGNRAIKITEIKLINFVEEESSSLKGSAELALTLEKVGKVYGGKRIFRKVELDFILDKTDKIITCGPLGMISLSGLTLSGTSSNETQESQKKDDDNKESTTATEKQATTTENNPVVEKVSETKQVEKKSESKVATQSQIMDVIQKMGSDPSSVNPNDAKKVQAIIDANPQLKEMQGMIKRMQDMQKRNQELLEQE